MTTFDYPALLTKAVAIVTKFGRPVTLVKLDTAVDDPAMPWRGKTNPRATPAASTSVNAVVVHPTRVDELGISVRSRELFLKMDAIYIVASSVDFRDYNEIWDGSEFWRIDLKMELKPGPTILLWYFGVKR